MRRIGWLDRMKGLLIILVVLGHAVGMTSHYATGFEADACRFVFKFIYFFHMPAFFVLAGVLARDSAWGDVLTKKMYRLLVPYWIFGLVSIVMFRGLIDLFSHTGTTDSYYAREFSAIPWWHMMGSLAYGASLPGTDGFRCNSVLWFLPCLFMCNLIMLGIVKSKQKLLPLLLAVGCLPLFVLLNRINCPMLPYGLRRIPELLPFAILGYTLSDRLKFESRAWFLLAVFYVVACSFVDYNWQMYLSYGAWTVTMAMGVFGTLLCCVLAKTLRGEFWGRIGRASLGIMLIHKWVLLLLMRLGVHEVVLSTVLGVSVSYGFVLVIRKYVPWTLGEKRIEEFNR